MANPFGNPFHDEKGRFAIKICSHNLQKSKCEECKKEYSKKKMNCNECTRCIFNIPKGCILISLVDHETFLKICKNPIMTRERSKAVGKQYDRR